jgi:enoyl-CoA hydratase/carnithine racemase
MVEASLRIRRDRGIAHLELNRPEAANAPDETMAALLREACADLAHDDAVRVVLLTGVDGAFCVATPDDATPSGAPEAPRERIAALRMASSVASLTQPVIVAINGDAVGQGLEIALAGDLRFAAEPARLSMPQVAWGGLPWDGGTQRLARTVGRAWTLDLLLTGRSVSAREALDMGLVHEVVPPNDLSARAQEMAERLASFGPIALRYTKEAVLHGTDLGIMAGLGLELDLNVLLHTTSDRAEGVGSFLERRDPTFRGE